MGNDHSFWQLLFKNIEHYLTNWKLLSDLWEKVHTESKYEDSYDNSPAWEMIIYKMLIRTAIREDPDQTASSEAV